MTTPRAANDDDTGLEELRTQAASGVPDAVFRYASALVVHGRMDEAAHLHHLAAAAGHAHAQIEYARMLLHGVGTDVDPTMAVEWLLRAEGLGNPIAGYHLALIALGNRLLPRDGRINARVLTAVQHDYPPALLAAAIHFGRKPDPADQATCVRLLERGAGRGDPVAALLLAERLHRGEGVDPQPAAARGILQQLHRHGVPPLPDISAPAPAATAPRQSGQVPPGTLALEDALQPVDWTMLSHQPRVMQVDGLLSADECRLLAAAAMPHLRRSQVVDPATGQASALQLRTSSDAPFDPVHRGSCAARGAAAHRPSARTELAHAEHLIVLRYQPGEEYRPHRDYLPDRAVQADRPAAGNRRRTICVYLNDVPRGGRDRIPGAGRAGGTARGRAVVFDNLPPTACPTRTRCTPAARSRRARSGWRPSGCASACTGPSECRYRPGALRPGCDRPHDIRSRIGRLL